MACAATSVFAQPQIIYYKFDETSGALARNSAVPGQGWENGALSAAPAWNTTTPQIAPAALNNTGLGRRLNTGYSLSERNASQPLTIELWFRTTGTGYQDFCNDSTNFGLWLNNGRIQAQIGGTTIQSTNTNNNDGTWRYVALTRGAANNWSLYWGTTAAGLTVVTGTVAHTFSSAAMGVLYWQGGTPATYSGEMDEFRLWSVQRTQAELEAGRFTPFITQDIDVFSPTSTYIKPAGTAAFTNVAAVTFTDYTFTVTNVRTIGNITFTPVTLSAITGCTAVVQSNPSTIAPGASTTFVLRVTPLQADFDFDVSVNHSGIPNPYTFSFIGLMNTGRPEMLYYRFNDGSGTTARNDASPGRGTNPSVFTAGPTWASAAQARLGASAAMSNASLNTAFSCTQLPRPEFTLEFWIFRSDTNTNTICGDGISFRVYRSGGGGGHSLRIQSGPAGGDQDINTNVTLTNNAWTHIAIVSNPGVAGLRVYRNGVQSFESINYTFPFSNATLTVMSNAGANNMTGRLDEFRFWAHVRTQTEINANQGNELIGSLQVERPSGTIRADGSTDALGNIATGNTQTLTYTLRNIGSTALLMGNPALAFSAATNCNVNITSNPTGVLIAGTGTTTAQVQVTPLAAGAFSTLLTFTSNDPDNPTYVVTVSGTGVSGEIQLERPSGTIRADGGADAIGTIFSGSPTALVYTVRNVAVTGNIVLGLLSTNTLVNCSVVITQPSSLTLIPAGTTTFQLDVTPTAAGAFSFNLNLVNDDSNENPYNVSVSGTAVTPPEINVQRPAGTNIADGGSDAVAGTVAGAGTLITYTIQNLGGSTLTLTGRSFANAVNCGVVLGTFSSATVAPAGTATLGVTITPAAAGAWSFDLDINSDDSNENPYDIAVSGTAAVGGEINVQQPAGTNIADGGSKVITGTVAGAPTGASFTIENLGTATLTLTGRAFANNINCNVVLGTFSSGTVGVGGSATLLVTVTPTAAGAWSFDLDINSDDLNEGTYDIAVSGTAAVGGEINVERPALTTIADAGSDSVSGTVAGAPTLVTYTIRNQGTATLTLVSRAFANNVNCGVALGSFSSGTIAPAGTATLGVTVTPTAAGAWSFDLDIVSDDLNETTYDIAVSGTAAVGGEINIERPALTTILDGGSDTVTGTVAGVPAPVTYTIRNQGTATLTLTGSSFANAVNCGVAIGSFSSGTIAPAGTATVTVTVTPTVAGSWSFDLDINSDDLNENPYDIAVGSTAAVGGEINVQQPAGTNIADGGSNVISGTVAGVGTGITYTIQNLGSATLTLTSRAFANNINCGVSLGSFSSGTVAPSGTATLLVTVTPTAAGAWSFDLDIVSDDLDETTYDIAVSGNAAVGGEINVERPALTTIADGGSDAVSGTVAGAPTVITYTIRNQGTATLTLVSRTFANNVNCGVSLGTFSSGTVAPAGTATLGVTITPTAAGAWSFDLDIVSDDLDEATYDIGVSGTAAVGGEINVERPALTTITDGASDSVTGTVAGAPTIITYTIRNQGTATLTLVSRAFANAVNCGIALGAFSTGTVAPAGTATLGVTITPTAAGAWSFDLDIVSDDLDETTYDIAISGTAAVGGEINVERPALTTIADTGSDAVAGTVAGAPTVITYTIRNQGTATLTLVSRTFANNVNCGVALGSFSSGTIAPAGTATLGVTITPTASGAWSFDLDIVSDDLDETTYDIAVSGAAAAGGEINVQRPAGTNIADGGSDAVTGTIAGTPTILIYTIQNLGTATLTLTGRSFANNLNCGVALGSFSAGTVGVGGSATLAVTVTPTAAGAWSFDLDITSDDVSEATYDIAVSGTAAVGGEIDVQRPVSTSIPSGGSDPVSGGVVGSTVARTYTIQNLGTATLTITGTGGNSPVNCFVAVFPAGSGSLAPSATTTFNFQITPSAPGAFSFNLTVSSNDADENPYTIVISGTAVPGGEIDVQRPAGTSIPAGGSDPLAGAVAGVTSNRTYTIQNSGTGVLTISATGTSGAQVNCGVIVGAPGSSVLATSGGGSSTTFTVDVTPTAAGAFSFTLRVSSDDQNENPYDITISGTAAPGGEIDIERPVGTSIADGGSDTITGAVAGVTTTVFYTIENQGTALLTITGQGFLSASNCGVTVFAPLSGSLAPAAATTMQVDITPTASGAFSFVLQVFSDDVNEGTYDINVSGSAAVGGDIDVERPFGTTIADGGSDTVSGAVAGVASPLVYRIENTGTATLTVGVVSISGQSNCGVAITQPGAASLAPGATTTFQVDVTPAAAGAFSFDIDVASDDVNENPYDIGVSGTAAPGGEIDIERPVGTPVLDGATDTVTGAVAGVMTSLVYRVENNGTATLTLGAVSFSNAVNCGVSLTQPASLVLAPGTFTTFQVDVTAVGTGSFSADIDVTSDDVSEGTYDIAISGTALSGGEVNIQRPSGTNIADGGTDNGPTGVVGAPTNLVYTVQNSGGTASLAVGTVSVTGATNCGVVITQPGAASLAPAASTTFQIDVTPAATGAFSFVLHLVNDDTNENPYDITYNATAVTAPQISVTTPVNYPDTNVGVTSASVPHGVSNIGGAALTITSISIVGANAGDWALVSPPTPPVVIFPSGTMTLNGRFTPTASGARTAQIRLVSNTGGVPGTITLITINGNATAANISVTTPVNYGSSNVGVQTAPVNHQVDNTGNGPMEITGIILTGANAGDWSLSGLPSFPHTVASLGNLVISGQFTPSALNGRTANIQISWNQGGGVGATTANIVLNGTGTQGTIGVTTPVNYGSSNLGIATLPVNHQVNNTGTGPLVITGISLSGANAGDWGLSGLPSFPHTIVSGGNYMFSGQCTPTVTGARAASIDIAWHQGSGVGATTATIVLNGNGTQAIISLTTPVNYGNSNVGVQTGPTGHTISNTGTGPMQITAIALGGAHAGDWSLSNGPALPVVVGAGGNVSIDGRFLPTATGARNATIDITWNQGGGSTVSSIVLNGNGTTGAVSATTPVNYGTIVVGNSSAPTGHQINNTGTGSARVTAIAVTGPNAASWSLTNLPSFPHTLAATTGNYTFDGTFTPSTTGAHTAAIEISWDNGVGTTGNLFTINVSGTGQIPSSITNVTVGVDDGGPVRVQCDVNGPVGNLVDVTVTYAGGANPGAAVIAGAGSFTIVGNVIQGVPVNTTLVFFWDAYATEGHTTAANYVITLSPEILGSPGTPGSSAAFTLTRNGGWVQHVSPSLQTPGGFGHTAVFDAANDRMIVFGGKRAGVLYNEIWVLERSGLSDCWRRLTPAGTPPVARQYHNAFYDAANGRMIMFGGNGASGPLNDTWALDLTRGAETWTQIATGSPATPQSRFAATMVFDEPNNRAVLFGGSRFGAFLNDTWALDLTLGSESWGTAALITAGTTPSGRWGHAGVFDTVNNRLVIFGGRISTGYTDTVFELTLGGTPTWSPISVTGTPGVRYFMTCGYDAGGNSLIFQSGYQVTTIRNDMWQLPLSGAGAHVWAQLPGDATASIGRVTGSAALDPGREQLLFFGGLGNGSVHLNTVSALDVSGPPAWSVPPFAANADAGAEARWGAVMAYDTSADRVFLWGGKDAAGYFNDVWVLDQSVPSGSWTRLTVTGAAPQPRVYPAFTYDSIGNRLIMQGGQLASGGYASDLWALDLASATWTEWSTGGIPGRARHSVAYDSTNNRAYVFGGNDGGVRGDAWYFDFGATTWNAVTVTGISARYGHGAVYDSLLQRMVVFAGRTASAYLIDVWELDIGSSTWTNRSAVAGSIPLSRYLFASASNSVGNRVWMHGGSHGNEMGDLWELDLTSATASWTDITPTGGPLGRITHMACEDGNGKLYVGFGFRDTAAAGDLWSIDTNNPGAGWTQAWQSAKPQSIVTANVVLDEANNRLISIGGLSGGIHDPGVWQLDLGNPVAEWSPLTPAGTSPAARRSASVVYDFNGGSPRILMYGGRLGAATTTATSQLWSLDLTLGSEQWTQLTPTVINDPGKRTQHTAILDGSGRMIVYGGSNDFGTTLGNVYALDTTTLTWTQVTTTGSAPIARFAHAAVYDAPRDRMIVYGGKNGANALSDAWELDLGAMAWSALGASGAAPGATFYHSMVVDETGQRMFLYGGFGTAARSGLYELDLTTDTWTQRTGSIVEPQARWAHGAVWDVSKARMAVVGGFYDGEISATQNGGAEAETWFWGD
jgi:hypothetical protein